MLLRHDAPRDARAQHVLQEAVQLRGGWVGWGLRRGGRGGWRMRWQGERGDQTSVARQQNPTRHKRALCAVQQAALQPGLLQGTACEKAGQPQRAGGERAAAHMQLLSHDGLAAHFSHALGQSIQHGGCTGGQREQGHIRRV